jgi:hypothetical protein
MEVFEEKSKTFLMPSSTSSSMQLIISLYFKTAISNFSISCLSFLTFVHLLLNDRFRYGNQEDWP